jgi:uncharacterized protein
MLAALAAGFGDRLRAEGLPIGPDRCTRFAEAITLLNPTTTRELRHCALATLISDPDHVPTFDAVFAAVFTGLTDPATQRGQTPALAAPTRDRRPARTSSASPPSPFAASLTPSPTAATRELDTPALASATERLAAKDFADLTPEELATLATLMRQLTVATPLRRSRRHRPAPHGPRIDLRATFTAARRTAGQPLRLRRSTRKPKPRRLVVLCDISGSMAPYARALLQFLYCATRGAKAEIFTFATRLTRLTPALKTPHPTRALEQAARVAPDWSSGTRIAHAIAEFTRTHGRQGMARGAIILIISDGWETGDPTHLGTQLATLSRLSHRIIWANPRTARPSYRPLTGGMAAAWPHCDAIVSAHNLTALHSLAAALRQ